MFEEMSAEEDAINLKKEQRRVIRFLLKRTSTECYSMMSEVWGPGNESQISFSSA